MLASRRIRLHLDDDVCYTVDMKTLFWVAVAAIVAVGGFFALNAYIYEEKQEPNPPVQEQPIVGELEEGGEADPARMTLTMTEWRWISATNPDGTVVKPKVEGQFTVSFDGMARFSAKTDCNQMGGKYTWNDGRIAFLEVISTKMYCEGSQEGVFGEILADAEGYRFTVRGEMILELASGGTATFR